MADLSDEARYKISTYLRWIMRTVNNFEAKTGKGGWHSEEMQEACNAIARVTSSGVEFGIGRENPTGAHPRDELAAIAADCALNAAPVAIREAVAQYRRYLEKFATFDAEGLVEPRKPYSWETLARVAIDLANSALAAPAAPAEPAPQLAPNSVWRAASANDTMRHPEGCDLTGGATDMREPDPQPALVAQAAAADWVDQNVSGSPSLMQAMRNHAAAAPVAQAERAVPCGTITIYPKHGGQQSMMYDFDWHGLDAGKYSLFAVPVPDQKG